MSGFPSPVTHGIVPDGAEIKIEDIRYKTLTEGFTYRVVLVTMNGAQAIKDFSR